jgi:sugar phosphate isomerase/epimerase
VQPETAAARNSSPRPSIDAFAPGISTLLFHPVRFVPSVHIPVLKTSHFDLVELCFFFDTPSFDWQSSAARSELLGVLRSEGVEVWSIHPPDRGVLGAVDSRDRKVQEDVLVQTAEVALEVGAQVVVFHAVLDRSSVEIVLRPDAKKRLVESLHRVAQRVSRLPVTLCLETMPVADETTAASLTNDEILGDASLYPPHGPFGIAIDTGHSHIAGNLVGQASRSGARLASLHINDNDGLSDLHLLPGPGTIDWDAFRSDLRYSGYLGPLMLEIVSGDVEPAIAAMAARDSIDRLVAPRE